MLRARLFSAFLPVALATTLAAGTTLLGIACGSTSTETLFPPITGITVRAEALIAGRGCGTGSTQIFKYVVVVSVPAANAPPVYAASNVYDCFTDGTFVDLPDIGIRSYDIKVYAYNRAAFTAGEDAGADAAASRIPGLIQSMNANRALVLADGGPDALARIEADLVRLRNTNPTYSTKCSAGQLQLVQSLAACKPLQLGTAGLEDGQPAAVPSASVRLSLEKFRTASAADLTCGAQYLTVRTTVRVGNGAASGPTDTRCSGLDDAGLTSSAVIINPAEAPASYAFAVQLLRADGSTLGATTCSADTSPGLESPATCQPLP